MQPRPETRADASSITDFDAGRWRALANETIEQPWQTLPDHLHRSSVGRPWRGLTVWHQVGPLGDLYVPPSGVHTILVRRSQPTRLLQRHGNAIRETDWSPGDAVVVPTETPSFWRSTAQRDNIHMALAPAWLHQAAGQEVELGNCFGRRDPVLAAFASLLMASLDDNSSLLPQFGDNMAMGIAVHVIEHYALKPEPRRARAALSSKQMRLLSEAVSDGLHEPWTVARLASMVGLSPFHFSRAFKTSFGITPHAWVQLQRMELAARLVRGSRSALTEIAGLCGYPSAAHFSHAFRQHWGMTPSAYRSTR